MSGTTEKAIKDFADPEGRKGVLALSRTFDVMSADAGIEALLGCKPAAGEHWPLSRLFAPQHLETVDDAVREVFRCRRAFENLQAQVHSGDGAPILCRCHLQPLIGSEAHTIGVIFTFYGLPQPEVAPHKPLRHTGDREAPLAGSAALFEHLPKGSFTIDAQWRIRSFNQAAEQITGFSRGEAVGRHCWEIFRAESCRKQCPMRQALDRKQPEMDRQVFSVNRSGQRQTLSVNISVMRNDQGEIVGAIETFHPAGGDRPSPFGAPGRLQGIIGNSPQMRALFAQLPDLAASRANVLICGESGTGKELIARTLHELSANPTAPFIAVNCASLAETLIESELFGHEKGAYTGAEQARAGRFELAGKGTLLLDEIGELKADLQIKLLRVIEQRSFERVGGTRSIGFEARLISSTHQDLAQAIQHKRFREDLFYRLRTVTLTVSPLRKRPEDIPLLVDHFIKKFNTKTGKKVRSLDPKVMQNFMAYSWPGNVRELEHCIEHAFVFVKGPVIFQHYLPDLEDFGAGVAAPLPERIDPDDRETVLWALKKSGGKREAASRLLGISRTSIWRRMKAMGLE
jgi:PAS domain S-box-containing protein